jgi:outer membrane protein assembly factor BamB
LRTLLHIAIATTCALAGMADAAVKPEVLPGKGLAQHDFLYAGEAHTRDVYIVRGGKVTWEFHDDAAQGEISDAQMASNGNIVLAHQFGVKVVGQDKRIVWSYPAEEGHEIHTAQFIGADRVIFIQSGKRPRIMIANIRANRIEREIPIVAGNLERTHGQVRHARLTPAGTYLVGQMDLGRAVEFDEQGKEIWSYSFPGIWSAERLANGNTLLCGKSGIVEIDPAGKTVWSLTPSDVPEYESKNRQIAQRLPNGNTLFNHWTNEWTAAGVKIDPANAMVQAIEVTPDKKVVWALDAWNNPNLGPSTTIQLLDRPQRLEDVHFGALR